MFSIATIEAQENTYLQNIQFFVYKQGYLNTSSIEFVVTVGGVEYTSNRVNLSTVTLGGPNFLGKINIEWPVFPPLTGGQAYPVTIRLYDYAPVLTEVQENDLYFSVLSDWPTTMGYNDPVDSVSVAPISCHLYGGI